jgi:hypothetical protein
MRPTRGNGGERFGALSAQVEQLIVSVRDMRVEVKADIASLRTEMVQRTERHEELDSAYRTEVNTRVERLESQALEAGKVLLARVDDVEKKVAASAAVDEYKKWIVGMGLGVGVSVVLSIINFLKPLTSVVVK